MALLITVWLAHLIKKRAPNCVFLFPEGYLLVVYSTSLPLLAEMSVPVCSFIPSPLFVHHPLLLWGSYCLCLFSCYTRGSKTYSLFRRDSKVVVFLYSVVSVGFFPCTSPSWLMFFITSPPALSTTPQSPTKCQSSVKEGAKQSRHDSCLCVRPPATVCVCVGACLCLDQLRWNTVSACNFAICVLWGSQIVSS